MNTRTIQPLRSRPSLSSISLATALAALVAGAFGTACNGSASAPPPEAPGEPASTQAPAPAPEVRQATAPATATSPNPTSREALAAIVSTWKGDGPWMMPPQVTDPDGVRQVLEYLRTIAKDYRAAGGAHAPLGQSFVLHAYRVKSLLGQEKDLTTLLEEVVVKHKLLEDEVYLRRFPDLKPFMAQYAGG